MQKTIKKSALGALVLASLYGSAHANVILPPDLQSASQERVIIAVNEQQKGPIMALAKRFGADIHVDGQGFFAASFKGRDLTEIKGLMNHPHISLIETDQLRQHFSFRDDTTNPHVTQTRSYVVTQSGANHVEVSPGGMKTVCVIDSGLDGQHPDFDFSQIRGQDDPGTGRWDVAGGAHGTHVAGIIAASDNAIGTLGIAPGTPLHIVKVFTEQGWAYSSTLAHAAQQCINAGAQIINMSLGGSGSSSTEASVFDSFAKNGGLAIAAAGNAGTAARSFPAGYASVMMVGANDANNQIAAFSQFPSCTIGTGRTAKTDDGHCVEVTAGGVRVMSAYPVANGTYGYMSGTSMATPVVAGVAASVWSHAPNCTGEQIRQALKLTAEDAGATGKDVYFGYGIVKADKALAYLATQSCSGAAATEPEPESAPKTCKGKNCK